MNAPVPSLTPTTDATSPRWRDHFTFKCPQCLTHQRFEPEVLYRSLYPTNNEKDFDGEPARFLLRNEEVNNGYDAQQNEDVQVLFASTCPNLKCQKPIFLKVEGKKIEFMKIMRGRLARPHGQTERDLRVADLKLVWTLPEPPRADPRQEWCDIELGSLCNTLNELAGPNLSKLSEMAIRSSCSTLLSRMIGMLEQKQVVLRGLDQLAKRDAAGFGLLFDLGLMLRNEPVYKGGREYRILKKAIPDREEMLYAVLVPPNDKPEVASAISALKDAARKDLEARSRKAETKPKSYSARLTNLQHSSLVPRQISHWARRIEDEIHSRHPDDFCQKLSTAELALFVRELAHSAFEMPFRLTRAIADRKETELDNIPTLGPGEKAKRPL